MINTVPKSAAIPLVIFISLEVVCLLAFGNSVAFLSESVFFFASLILTTLEIIKATDNRSALFGLPAILVSITLFVLQGTLCIASAALGNTSMPYIAISSIVLLTVGTIPLFTGLDAEAHMRHIERSELASTSPMDEVRLKLSALAIEAQGEIKPIVEKLCEEARLANPRGTLATEPLDLRMVTEVERLTDAVLSNNAESARASAAALSSLIRRRSIISTRTTSGGK